MESRHNYQPARSHQRFKAMHRALVLINQGPEALPYHIMDISEGGLSFRYLGQKLDRAEVKEISLYHDFELVVDAIPVQTVSDYRLQDNLVPVRRGSLHFENLNNEQKSRLEKFIKQYTEAPLPLQ
jgi:hypothetical protein